jgi:glycerophosphoryl diester phosphodiesterase
VSINTLTAAELQATAPSLDTAIPTLRDALDLCARLGLGPYLELKEAAAIDSVVAELAQRDLGRYSIVGAFNPAWVARVTDRAPHLATSVLFGVFEIDPVALARAAGARYVHPCWERHPTPDTLLTPAWLDRVRQAELGVVCWHEERPPVLAALLRLGLSGICTDRLDLLDDAARYA